MSLPNRLLYGSVLSREENNQTEFKAVEQSKHLVEAISRYAREYINAFLNSHGGQILFGVEDNSIVKGVLLSNKLEEEIKLAVDGAVAAFVPEVESCLYETTFISVQTETTDFTIPERHSVDEDDSSCFINNDTGEKLKLVVVVITVQPGIAPVYYISKENNIAFFRRDGGITKMTPDTIVERVQEGRSAQGIKPMTDELDFTCRKQTVRECIEYFEEKHPLTKILQLYGLVSVGKSRFADYLREIIQSDREEFPIRRKVFSVDLKGTSGEKFKNVNDTLAELIHSMKPEFELNSPSSPDDTETNSGDSFDSYAVEARLETYNEPLNEKQLCKVYLQIMEEIQPLMLIFDNAGNCPYLQDLLPSELDIYIIIISRTKMVFENPKPFQSFKEIALQPLTDDEGAILIMSILGVSAEEGRNISRLCAGLPQVIRLICRNCKLYGVPPMQVLLNLNKTAPSAELSRIQPNLYEILSGLESEQLETLAIVSLFPGVFQDEAVSCLLGASSALNSPIQRFRELVDLGLIDKMPQPSVGLRHENWWRVTEAIREFAYNNIRKDLILEKLKAYIEFFSDLLNALNAELELEFPNKSTIFRKLTLEEIVKGTYDLFLCYSRSFTLLLQILNAFLQDPRNELRKLARPVGQDVIKASSPFSNFYTQEFCQELQALHKSLRNRHDVDAAGMLDLDLDSSIWRRLYE